MLGILKIILLFIPYNYTMQKRLPLVPSEKTVTSTFALYYLSVVQFTWYPSIHLLNLSHLSSPIGNNLLTNAQLLGGLFLCLRIIFVQQYLQFHIFGGFPCSLSSFLSCIEVTTFETPKPSFTRVLRWSMFTTSFSKWSV